MANPNVRKAQYHVIHFGAKHNIKYNRAELADIDPSTIPTLIPESVMIEFGIKPTDYYKVQAIEFPIKANGFYYETSFARSYINALNIAPMPGSKNGHEMAFGKRGKTDLLLVGGKVVEGENNTAIMYLKNWIPEKLDTDNSVFIKESKSNMIHFSLVTYSRDVLTDDGNGNREWHVVEHMYGGRNDAVDRGTGAMAQKTNAAGQKIISASVSHARRLITEGSVDKESSWSVSSADENKILGDPPDWNRYKSWHFVEDTNAALETKGRYKYLFGKNGKVYASALRAVASRAGQQGLSELSDLATKLRESIDEKENIIVNDDNDNNMEQEIMKESELLGAIKEHASNSLVLPKMLQALGCEIVTEQHKNALKIVDELTKIGVSDPVKTFADIQENAKKNAAQVHDARLDKEFGITTKEKPNMLREYAGKMIPVCSDKEYELKLNSFKQDPIAIRFAEEMANTFSGTNAVGEIISGSKKDNSNQDNDSCYVTVV